MATTDLVNARALLEGSSKTLKLIESSPEDRPLAVQVFGSDPVVMRDAAAFLEARGVASVDINMGCPVRKICKTGGGSSMMRDFKQTLSVVRRMVEGVSIPVTAKMRLGWDDENITAPELARALEEEGIAAIFVHGRTREQGFDGTVNLAGIRRVVESVERVPVIGNGDVTTPEAAKKMVDATGCAGVGIGRGAFYNPWIFHHTRHYLRTGETPPEPSFSERVRVMCRHLDLMIQVFGEAGACQRFRKVAPWYAKRFGPANFFNKRVVHITTKSDFDQVLADYLEWREQFLDENGELKPKYQPSPMAASFLTEEPEAVPAVARRDRIPVPKGPVEVW